MNRRYLIINTNELDRVDFGAVAETSADTVRKSIDQTKTFVKWNHLGTNTEQGEGEDPVEVEILPSFVSGVGLSSERVAISTYQGPYSHSEILEILSGEDWTSSEGPA